MNFTLVGRCLCFLRPFKLVALHLLCIRSASGLHRLFAIMHRKRHTQGIPKAKPNQSGHTPRCYNDFRIPRGSFYEKIFRYFIVEKLSANPFKIIQIQSYISSDVANSGPTDSSKPVVSRYPTTTVLKFNSRTKFKLQTDI